MLGGVVPCPGRGRGRRGGLCYAKSLSSPTVSRLRSIPRRCSNSGYQWRSAGAKINTQSLHRAAAPGCVSVFVRNSIDTWSSWTISAEQQPTERTWPALISAPSRPLKSTPHRPLLFLRFSVRFRSPQRSVLRYNKSLSTITTLSAQCAFFLTPLRRHTQYQLKHNISHQQLSKKKITNTSSSSSVSSS